MGCGMKKKKGGTRIMSEEEIYKIITKDVFKYPLLNQIFAIRDNRYKIDNKSICVNGYISLDTIEKAIQLQKENEELKNKVVKRDNELIDLEEYAEKEFITKQEVKENYWWIKIISSLKSELFYL